MLPRPLHGGVPHQKGRVEQGGKSVFSGHCATAAQCLAKLTPAESVAAAAAFAKRCDDADAKHKLAAANEVDEAGEHSDQDEEGDEGDDGEFVMVRKWHDVYCDCCARTIQGTGFYHWTQEAEDVCAACYNSRLTPRQKAEYVWWASSADPYGGRGADYVVAGDFAEASVGDGGWDDDGTGW